MTTYICNEKSNTIIRTFPFVLSLLEDLNNCFSQHILLQEFLALELPGSKQTCFENTTLSAKQRLTDSSWQSKAVYERMKKVVYFS